LIYSSQTEEAQRLITNPFQAISLLGAFKKPLLCLPFFSTFVAFIFFKQRTNFTDDPSLVKAPRFPLYKVYS